MMLVSPMTWKPSAHSRPPTWAIGAANSDTSRRSRTAWNETPARRLRWVSITPRGRPVVPPV